MSLNEWIGFGVAALCAGALVSAMLWMSGCSRGVPPAALRRAIARLWVAVVACIGGLVGLRALLGGGIVEVDAYAASIVVMRQLPGAGWTLVALGVAWTVAWMIVALRAAASIGEGQPPSQDPGRD